MSKLLKSYTNKSGEYIIPVEWSVYSTVIVEADNLEEAVKLAKAKLDEIPLCRDAEYIDGTYAINGDTDEDLIVAQAYKPIGNIKIHKNGEIERW